MRATSHKPTLVVRRYSKLMRTMKARQAKFPQERHDPERLMLRAQREISRQPNAMECES